MSLKSQFTDEEWTRVIQAPMLAGMAVTAADPSGLWATIKEASAMAQAIIAAKSSAGNDSLLHEICMAFNTSEGRGIAQDGVRELMRGRKAAEVAEAAVARLAEVAAFVATNAPEHSVTFKEFLRTTAQRVAEAGTEGGFLGFGGEKVSEAEKKTLADIDRVLEPHN